MKQEMKEKAYAAFKKKYHELPADAGFPVVRERMDCVYFARNLDDWHEFAKDQKFLTKLLAFIVVAVMSIIAVVFVDILFVSNHRLLLYALAAYCILLILVTAIMSVRRPRKLVSGSNREILCYDEYENKIYIIVL